MKILKFSAFFGLVIGVALLSGGRSEAAPSLMTVAKRTAAPTFTLKDSTGKEVRLTGYKGKVVRPYLDKMHMSYRVLLGDEPVTAQYGGIESLPLTPMIDREGRIAARHVGLTSKSNFERDIVELIRR